MNFPAPGTAEWLEQVKEDIIDPDRPIIDSHHHLRPNLFGHRYLLKDFWADTASGHNIVKTVYIECAAEYRDHGPEHMRCLGETEFAIEQAKKSDANPDQATIVGIVGKVDLTRGVEAKEVLEAHVELGQGRFRGVRHAGARAKYPEELLIAGSNPQGLYLREDFRSGVKLLGSMGLTYDTWHYHYQNRDFLELAKACPDTLLILDHFGTPLGVGRYAGKKEEIYEQWKRDIAALAECDNVIAKLGGLAMPDNGFGWHKRQRPATSDEFCQAQRRYYLHTIECFGPDRCMTESNFPVDKLSISYHVFYNGLKKILADFSEDEKHAMFYGTAARVYKLD